MRDRIVAMRQAGGSYRGIARTLTEEGVPTATGKATWAAETVRTIHRAHGEAEVSAG